MKSKMMKLTTKVTTAIMVASALATSASPALVMAKDSAAITENVATEEATVESEAVVEEPVTEEVTEEPVVDGAVAEEAETPVVEEAVAEEALVEEAVTETSDDEEAAAEETSAEAVERVDLVEFVDEGYEEVAVDPEAERVVTEIESNMTEAEDNANGDANDIIDYLEACDLEEVKGFFPFELTFEELQDKQAKDEEQKEKEKEKEELENSISEAGTIAGNFAIDVSKIEFNDYEEYKQVAALTFKKVNENIVSKIPYVGGFISAILNGVIPGDSGDAAKEDPNTAILENISQQLNDVIKTIQAATYKQIQANDIQNCKNNFQKVEDAARKLQNKYKYNNSEYKAVMESLDRGEEIYDYADEVFKNIYDVNSDSKPYFDAYMDFADSSMNFTTLIPGVTATDVLSTYDLIVSLDKTKDTKYLFNNERDALTDRVEYTLDVGYSVLRFCMELELAKQDNLKAACDAKLKELVGDEKDGNGGRKAELTEEAENLEKENQELADKFETSTDDEKKDINEKISANNEQLKAINEEIAAVNEKVSEVQTIRAKCVSAIYKIGVDTDALNEKKDKANKRIRSQRESILEGYEYLTAKEKEDKATEIKVHFDKAEALEFTHNGKKIIAYPKFSDGAPRVEYVDIFGNVWAHQDVKYTDVKDWNTLKAGGKYLFWFNGAASRWHSDLVGEEAVVFRNKDKNNATFYMENHSRMRNGSQDSLYWCSLASIASVRQYRLGEIVNEL